MTLVTGATGHAGRAPSTAGWHHSATTSSQSSGMSEPQAGACHLESPCALRTRRMPLLCRGRLRASMIWLSFRRWRRERSHAPATIIIRGRGDVVTRFILLLSADASVMHVCKQGRMGRGS
jgi:hypothetical protein